jgi:hypothetical protein
MLLISGLSLRPAVACGSNDELNLRMYKLLGFYDCLVVPKKPVD